MNITFTIEDGAIKHDNPDCTHGEAASIATYCILYLAEANNVPPDEIVAELLRISKACLKQESDHKQD